MTVRTGLAILTYVDRQRPPAVGQRLWQAIESLKRTGFAGPIAIVDDGSTCPVHQQYLDRLAAGGRYQVIRRQINGGISRAKNTCLRAIAGWDVDIGFLAEDDILFHEGWDRAYLDAMQCSGIEHFSWYTQGSENRTLVCGGALVSATGGLLGLLMTFTRRALQQVGGFKVLPHRYGYEHIQWTYRCILAGLAPFPADIVDSHRFIERSTLPSSVDAADREDGIVKNLDGGYAIDRICEPFEE